MSETLWQKAYEEYVQDNSYQGKLKKENDKLKAKLEKMEQIMNKESEGYIQNNPCLREIREVLNG